MLKLFHARFLSSLYISHLNGVNVRVIGEITALPLFNIFDIEGDNKWSVTEIPAQLELKSNNFPIPPGWVLIEGKLIRRSEDFTAYLIVKVKDKNTSPLRIPLPVSLKGIFSELIYLPKDIDKLILEPMQAKGEIELFDLSIKSVGLWGKKIRMLYRVIAFYEKHSFEFCYRAGLRLHTSILHLSETYSRVGRFKYFAPTLNYADWLKEFDALSVKERSLITKQIKGWARNPYFEILIYWNDSTEVRLQQTFDSLDKQIFRNFSVTLLLPQNYTADSNLLDLPEWVNILEQKALSLKLKKREEFKWIMFVEPGVVLADHAIYWLASTILNKGDARFIYSDHDYINQDGLRNNPEFKPDWSPELLRSTNYIGSSVTTIRSDILLKVVNLSELNYKALDYYELFLRVSEQLKNNAIRHIPVILGHLPYIFSDRVLQTNTDPVIDHLKRLGISAIVEAKAYNRNRVIYSISKNQPLISLIIPTRDALSLLKPCVESILKLSSYQNFELIIVDNQSDDQATFDYLDSLEHNSKIRILQYDQPFNYSAINNFAVKESLGEVICLLNNDTEVITPGWLEEMLGHLMQQKVGVVGAKLYFSDGRVQHAGDTVGPGGCASHFHSMIGHDSPGYCNRAMLAQDLSAVTGACLMTWRKLFNQVGGLDQVNLAVAFNDVDYCLKVREAGYRVVWTPYAELYHYESISRGQDNTPEKVKRSRHEANYMRKRWKDIMHHDPFYNPNLSYQRPDFSLSHAPMISKPWEQSIWRNMVRMFR